MNCAIHSTWVCRLAALAVMSSCFAAAAMAADETPKSSDAAVRQYKAAAAFQNKQVYDLAVGEWTKFLEKFPKDPLAAQAQHYLGVCQFQLAKYPEAEAAFVKVVADYPKYADLDATYMNLGLAQYNQGQKDPAALARAVATFATLIKNMPMSGHLPTALYYQAESLYGMQKKAEALSSYATLVEKHPKHALRAKALYGLGVAQEETGAAADARKTYDAFLTEFPKDPLVTEIGMRRAETLLASGELAEAEKGFAAAAAVKDFEFADYALLRQAVCRYEQKKYAEAGQLYAQLTTTFPKSSYVPTAVLAAGKCYFLAGNLDEARKWLSAGQKLGGDSAIESAHWVARSLLRENKPADALQAVSAVLESAAKSVWLADLKMDQADALYEIPDKRKDSVAVYAAIAKDFPEHRSAPQAAYLASYAALGVGDHAAALSHAAEFRKANAKHELLPDVIYVEAESNLQLKKYPEAAALFKQLLAEYPSRPEAEAWTVRLALCSLLEKKYDDVIATLGPKLAQIKTPEGIAEAQFLIGSSQFELKKYPEAIAALKASLAASPKWRQAVETTLLLAQAQRLTKDYDGATAALNKAIADFAGSNLLDQAYFRLGEVKYSAGDFAAAETAYKKVVADWPQSTLAPHAAYGVGWSHLSRKQYEPATAAMSALIEKFPEHSLAKLAHYARAQARQQAQDYAGAISDIAVFLKSDPQGADKSDALFVKGLCEVGLKQYPEAVKSFQSILEADPKYAATDEVLYELAWANLSQDKKPEAAEVFARLAKEFPKSGRAADAQYRVGEFEYQKKDYPKAAAAYFAAVGQAGKTELGEKAAHMLAWSYFQQKDYPKAQEAFDFQVKGFADGAMAADALAMSGECLFQQKKYEPALAALLQAIAKKPSNGDLDAVALLHAGQSAAALKKWDESLKLLDQCLMKYPETPYKDEVLYEQGWAKQNLNKLDEAYKLYEAVADNGDTVLSARARFMSGEILFLQQKYDAAVKNFFLVAYGYGHPKSPEPYHSWQANATFEAARCLENLKKIDAAKKLYKELVDQYPKSDKLDDAKKKLATLSAAG